MPLANTIINIKELLNWLKYAKDIALSLLPIRYPIY